MGYYTKYDVKITPRPDLETIQRFGRAYAGLPKDGELIDAEFKISESDPQ